MYGLTIQDDFSKFIQFVGIKDCTAERIAKALIQSWILPFGIPKIILSDNGSNLCGEIMTCVASYFNIKRITTAIAHPQSNGSVERAHARLAEFIRATDSELEHDMDWEILLQLASNCYNSTVHSTTKYSPYYLMFGRHPRLITAIDNPTDILADTYLESFHENLKFIWKNAKESMDKSKLEAIEREKQSVKRRKVEEFKIGDEVLVLNEVFVGKKNRTQDEWVGPFKVIEVRDTNLVVKKWRNTTRVVNKSKCKLFIPDTPSGSN